MTKHSIPWLNIPGYKGETWNPIIGCNKISDGCRECYAEKMAFRIASMEWADDRRKLNYCNVIDPDTRQWKGETHLVNEALNKPFHWKQPRAIFVCSMGDLFHYSVNSYMLRKVMDVIVKNRQHIFILLTKRPQNIDSKMQQVGWGLPFPPNVWLGVTVESQKHLNRVNYLNTIEAEVKFISHEPLLSAIDYGKSPLGEKSFKYHCGGIGNCVSWVIVGGESGHHARPMHPEWVRSIRDQCKAANVPFFFKQWGEWISFQYVYENLEIIAKEHPKAVINKQHVFNDGTRMIKLGRKAAGHLLDNKEHLNFPKIQNNE